MKGLERIASVEVPRPGLPRMFRDQQVVQLDQAECPRLREVVSEVGEGHTSSDTQKASAFISIGMGSCWGLGSRGIDDLAWC